MEKGFSGSRRGASGDLPPFGLQKVESRSTRNVGVADSELISTGRVGACESGKVETIDWSALSRSGSGAWLRSRRRAIAETERDRPRFDPLHLGTHFARRAEHPLPLYRSSVRGTTRTGGVSGMLSSITFCVVFRKNAPRA